MTNRLKRITPATIRALWLDLTISKDEAARRAGMTGRNLQTIARKLSLPHRPNYAAPASITDTDELRRMWAAGLSTADMAAMLGCHGNTVLRTARKLGLPSRHRGFTGACTPDEYLEAKLAARMAESAARTQAEMIRRNMADYSGSRPTGIDHARGLL